MGLTASKVAPLRIACAVASASYDANNIVDIAKCEVATIEALDQTPTPTNIASEDWRVCVFDSSDVVTSAERAVHSMRTAAQSEIVAIINEAQIHHLKELDAFLARVANSGAKTPALLANLLAYAVTLHLVPLTLSDAVSFTDQHRTLQPTAKRVIGLSVSRQILPEYVDFASRSAQHLVIAAYAGAISDTISAYPPAELICRALYTTYSVNRSISVSVAIGAVLMVVFVVLVSAYTISHILSSHNASISFASVIEAHNF